jgi:sulfur-oxidizing protein SoxY
MNRMLTRRPVAILAALGLALGVNGALAAAENGGPSEATWSEIRSGVVGDRPIEDGAGLVSLEAPPRAEDAALVPLDIVVRLPEGDTRRLKSLTLVVDENPAPIVGRFTLDPRRDFALSTRVRVNSYSYARAIAETDDGRLYMTKRYVKAAGGCSAPAGKDPAEATAHLGEMRFRVFVGRGDAQVQIRHPNYSGLQMDQVTRLYTPAWYVETLAVRQGDHTLLGMEGGISISEDPTFRFSYAPTGEPVIVDARDNQGRVFSRTFPGEGGS